jgi:hypothetical protein
MGRGLRWESLAHLGANLNQYTGQLPVARVGKREQPAKRRQTQLGCGGSILKVNKGEELFAFQAGVCNLPAHERNYRFHPTRKWEIDFAWPQFKIGLEIQGGIWGKSADDKTGGAHGHPIGITRDMHKHNALLALGWSVYLFAPADVKNGKAVKHLESVLGLAVTIALTSEVY